MTPRVLVVDGSPTVRMDLQHAFEAHGFGVTCCATLEQARAALADTWSIVILDVLLPDGDGLALLEELRSAPSTATVPVVLLSTAAEVRDRICGLRGGACVCVGKPYDVSDLIARTRVLLRAGAGVELEHSRKALLDELAVKDEELRLLNEELRSFAYTVSHDLRQPLRAMDGFSQALLERYSETFDEQGRHYLNRIRANAVRMGNLIDGLLGLSHVTRKELQREPIRLDSMAREIALQLRDQQPERAVSFTVTDGLEVVADRQLLASALENLLGNAWKFTARCEAAQIELGVQELDGQRVFFVRDNGVGFDMAYSNKLFGPFQRLHSAEEFAGTGIGLATVHRIVQRHRGRIWAKSEVGVGSTFFFTLGAETLEEAS